MTLNFKINRVPCAPHHISYIADIKRQTPPGRLTVNSLCSISLCESY